MSHHPTAYRAVPFAELPGWSDDDHLAAFRTFAISCERLRTIAAAASPPKMPPPADLVAVCATAAATPAPATKAAAKTFFERHFTPHTVSHAGPRGLLTGYYEPVLAGSRVPDARFAIPVHRRPADLVNLVDEAERGAKNSGPTHARQTANGPQPFPTRSEIDRGALAGQGLELLYLADPVDKFFMQIQGSGRIRLPDGTFIRLAYAGKNGHPYASVGRYLIDQGVISAGNMTLESLGAWLRADPDRGRKVMWQNNSYVFFREMTAAESAGPLGALEVPVTAGRSLAVDPAYHPLGLPIYVSSPTLVHATKSGGFQRLMIAQDVGSAIKGPERGDIYFGTGPAAGQLAGVTKHAGVFHVLLPTPEAVPTPKPVR